MIGSVVRSRAAIGLVLVVPALLLALAQPVAAAAPLADRWVQVYPEAQNDGLTAACGFPVIESGVENISVTSFLNPDGSLRQADLRVRASWTETNANTGATATQSYVFTAFDAFAEIPTLVGMPNKVLAGGVSVIDAGLLTFVFADGEVVKIAGPHPTFFDGIDWCGILGG